MKPPLLFPYQEIGRDFLAAHERCGLFDEMGLGKSAQAISALDKLGAVRGVIICPASARAVWVGEIKKFSHHPRIVAKGMTDKDLKAFRRYAIDILILSYEKATTWQRKLQGELLDFVIFDEVHFLKNHNANRTHAAFGHNCSGDFGYGRMGAYVWCLTGTPMANQPTDIWTWLRFCGGTDLTLSQFHMRYFVARPGSFNNSYTPRKESLPELQAAIERYSLRRTTKQAGIDLPKLWITTQSIEGDTAEVKALLAEHPDLAAEVLAAVEKGGLSFLEAQHVSTLRRLVGEAKAPVFAQQLVDEIAAGLEKVVIFCAHKRTIEVLEQALTHARIGYVTIDGAATERERKERVEEFQTLPETKVFLGNIVAAGTAITLTAANRLVMLESSWQPAANAQALKRVHRIGQGNKVHVIFVELANSIDEQITETVARKTAAIAMVEGKTDG